MIDTLVQYIMEVQHCDVSRATEVAYMLSDQLDEQIREYFDDEEEEDE